MHAARNLFRELCRQQWLFLAVSSILLAGFELLLCAIVATIDVGGAFSDILKSVPPLFRDILHDQFLGGLTSRGILAFGWNHPITLAIGTGMAIFLAIRSIAAEVEGGTSELVLSQPITRATYFLTHAVFGGFVLILLTAAGIAGTSIGQTIYRLDLFDVRAMTLLGINYFLHQYVWYGMTLMLSARSRESGPAATSVFLLALLSYLIQVIGRLWSTATFLLPLSLHTYYQPREILTQNTVEGHPYLVLVVIIIVSTGIAFARFAKRDIP